MLNSDINISFNIDAWRAHSNGLSLSHEWESWANNLQWPEEGKLITTAIPPMMRRRMSNLSKLAVQTTIELLSEHEIDYLVFASRHGELHRSTQIIDDILHGEEASPMAFSQSVHNTAAGLATIATKKPIPLTSIAASENTFQSAIVEAWLYLDANPQHKVLVIDFDEPLPEAYAKYEAQHYQGYGFGLVLSNGEDFSLSQREAKETSPTTLPQGLEFIRHFLSNRSQWSIESPRNTWSWRRK
ncbi:beta-ketoacyl synthase chain length factor [Vibrio bivalvicida]|uniref:3-oxoacyl-ACP synthase n=1 Tax=Vibrio bivalvicida TaxID=1276888 RepID=A0A177Y1Z0_9VIBR|nr:beta-ketoacyl synthase chain length factor [Vibrio bivalvicida]OAJ94889.1 3-oxoacyl-ACP synthase [Vibrio bivalvicida]